MLGCLGTQDVGRPLSGDRLYRRYVSDADWVMDSSIHWLGAVDYERNATQIGMMPAEAAVELRSEAAEEVGPNLVRSDRTELAVGPEQKQVMELGSESGHWLNQ